jgi:hypothetical protein
MQRDPASARVQLEVALLDADQSVPAPAAPAALDEHTRLTVLVIAAEADLRRYVRECLRERTDLRVLDAATVAAAVALAADSSPTLLIVGEPQGAIVDRLANVHAIVIVDDVPRGTPVSGTQRRLLARPFTAERLLAEVGQLLG